MIRIGIDARKIADSGIGRVIENVIDGMIAVGGERGYVLFFAPEDIENYDYSGKPVTKVIERAGKYSVKEHLSLAQAARRSRVDIFHAPHYTLPLGFSGPSVVTVHDLIHIKDRSFGRVKRFYAWLMISAAISRADRVIAVSETTKKSIEKTFPRHTGKVRVVLNGAGDFSPAHPDDTKSVTGRLGILPGYLLFVGSDRPHKNLKAVAKVMSGLNEDVRLVVVGRVLDKSDYLSFGDRVKFLDGLAMNEMRVVYTEASLLLFPSYLEGFGLPILEAMACHTPVVASNRSSIPEVAGDAAVLLDPDDYDGMTKAVEKIMTDSSFAGDLIAKGKKRVEQFSWDKTAKETLAVYDEVLKERGIFS